MVASGESGDRGLVMRLSGGAADAAFGTAGSTRVQFATAGRFDAVASTDVGGAVAAGRRVVGNETDTVVTKLKANGTFDSSFNGNGRLTFDAGGTDAATAVVVAGDGSVFVGGNGDAGGYVAHYTAAGVPDTAWDGDGRRSGLPLSVLALALRGDGTLMVAGATTPSPGDWRVMRLATDGSTDTGFGGSTGVTVDLGGHDVATALAVQSGGATAVAGFGAGDSGHGETYVRRYLADGSSDPDFTGFHDTFGSDDAPVAMVGRGDGALLVAANSRVGGDNDVVLVRLDADGTPDLDFGIDGATIADVGRRSTVGGVVVPPDGLPLAVGSIREGSRDLAAAFRVQPDGSSAALPAQGVVLDAYGGIHPWSSACLGGPAAVAGYPYWRGWDIARGIAMLPGSRGIVVDGWGGVHGFTFDDGAGNVPVTHGTPSWRGWDIVRGIAVTPKGTGGYVLDGWGGLHPFSIGSASAPPRISGAPYWRGWDIARGVALMPDGQGGYVIDGTGAIHRFGGAPAVNPGGPRWPGQDIARGIALAPGGSGGWVLDRVGRVHPFGTGGDPAPTGIVGGPYWGGAPLARSIATLP